MLYVFQEVSLRAVERVVVQSTLELLEGNYVLASIRNCLGMTLS